MKHFRDVPITEKLNRLSRTTVDSTTIEYNGHIARTVFPCRRVISKVSANQIASFVRLARPMFESQCRTRGGTLRPRNKHTTTVECSRGMAKMIKYFPHESKLLHGHGGTKKHHFHAGTYILHVK